MNKIAEETANTIQLFTLVSQNNKIAELSSLPYEPKADECMIN